MRKIVHKRAFGEKKRKAVDSYVPKVNQQIELAAKPEATLGPEGDVVVLCSFDLRTQAREKTVRRVMAKASQQVLDASGVWVVGIPQNVNGHPTRL